MVPTTGFERPCGTPTPAARSSASRVGRPMRTSRADPNRYRYSSSDISRWSSIWLASAACRWWCHPAALATMTLADLPGGPIHTAEVAESTAMGAPPTLQASQRTVDGPDDLPALRSQDTASRILPPPSAPLRHLWRRACRARWVGSSSSSFRATGSTRSQVLAHARAAIAWGIDMSSVTHENRSERELHGDVILHWRLSRRRRRRSVTSRRSAA